MDKEMEKVVAALEDFGRKVVKAVKKGKGEADRVARMAQIRLEISSLDRQRREMFQELGELFYASYSKPSKGAQEALAELVAHIGQADRQVASLRRALKTARKEPDGGAKKSGRRGRPPKAAGAKKPGRRGRPPKAAAGAKVKPKRRGRPPKSQEAAKE